MADISKLNFLGAAAAQANPQIAQTQAVGQSFTQATKGQSESKNPFGSQLFAGNTVGINNNIQAGDSVNIAAQAGKSAGVGRTLGIA